MENFLFYYIQLRYNTYFKCESIFFKYGRAKRRAFYSNSDDKYELLVSYALVTHSTCILFMPDFSFARNSSICFPLQFFYELWKWTAFAIQINGFLNVVDSKKNNRKPSFWGLRRECWQFAYIGALRLQLTLQSKLNAASIAASNWIEFIWKMSLSFVYIGLISPSLFPSIITKKIEKHHGTGIHFNDLYSYY